jgi:tRNA-2-methylthio-N6-dimethylallyladenosine synthase
VPYTRGAEISRPWDDIVAEAHALVDAGAREIVLLGQNVNAWATGARPRRAHPRAREDRWARADPLHHQPSADMTDALIAAHGEVDKLMPYLHLPVQSGSNRILKAMNRSHDAETYLGYSRRCARPARHRALRRLHRRLPRRDRGGFRGDAADRRRGRLRRGLFVQVQRRAGHPGRTMEEQIPREVMDDGCSGCRPGSRAQPRLQPLEVGADTQVLIERRAA